MHTLPTISYESGREKFKSHYSFTMLKTELTSGCADYPADHKLLLANWGWLCDQYNAILNALRKNGVGVAFAQISPLFIKSLEQLRDKDKIFANAFVKNSAGVSQGLSGHEEKIKKIRQVVCEFMWLVVLPALIANDEEMCKSECCSMLFFKKRSSRKALIESLAGITHALADAVDINLRFLSSTVTGSYGTLMPMLIGEDKSP